MFVNPHGGNPFQNISLIQNRNVHRLIIFHSLNEGFRCRLVPNLLFPSSLVANLFVTLIAYLFVALITCSSRQARFFVTGELKLRIHEYAQVYQMCFPTRLSYEIKKSAYKYSGYAYTCNSSNILKENPRFWWIYFLFFPIFSIILAVLFLLSSWALLLLLLLFHLKY